jgi:hypothetical protein
MIIQIILSQKVPHDTFTFLMSEVVRHEENIYDLRVPTGAYCYRDEIQKIASRSRNEKREPTKLYYRNEMVV